MKVCLHHCVSKSLENRLSRIRSSNAGRLRSRPPGCLGKSERCEKHPAGKNGRKARFFRAYFAGIVVDRPTKFIRHRGRRDLCTFGPDSLGLRRDPSTFAVFKFSSARKIIIATSSGGHVVSILTMRGLHASEIGYATQTQSP